MFKSKTVFVVGAGASSELRFPLGTDLRDQIAQLVNMVSDRGGLKIGDEAVVSAAGYASRDLSVQFEDLRKRALVASAGLPFSISIDNFLHAHADDALMTVIGKLGISRAILHSEGNSHLRIDKIGDLPKLVEANKTWLGSLARFLTEGVQKSALDDLFANVSFIIFNYDRSVEFYLQNALSRYFAVDPSNPACRLPSAAVVHPYGSVGRLPGWDGDGREVAFGQRLEGRQLYESSKHIRTFTEGSHGGVRERIEKMLSDAATIVFLGFGFIDQNMRLLELSERGRAKRVYATAIGLSESNCSFVERAIRSTLKLEDSSVELTGTSVELRPDLTSAQLFYEYSRSITQ